MGYPLLVMYGMLVVIDPSVCVCVFSEGEEWQSVRRLLGKHMLRPKAVEAYDLTLNAVVTDLVEKLKLRQRENASGLVTDVSAEFYRFGLEGEALTLLKNQ